MECLQFIIQYPYLYWEYKIFCGIKLIMEIQVKPSHLFD